MTSKVIRLSSREQEILANVMNHSREHFYVAIATEDLLTAKKLFNKIKPDDEEPWREN